MAISIDWATKIITVPKTDTTQVSAPPNEVRELDLDWFRGQLNDLQDDEAGIPFPTTHIHNTTVTISGVTLARVIEIVNGYTVTFEDGQYAVSLVGANSNIADVANVNQVSIRPNNSAGLIETATGSGPTAAEVADAVWDEATADHQISGSFGKRVTTISSIVTAILGLS